MRGCCSARCKQSWSTPRSSRRGDRPASTPGGPKEERPCAYITLVSIDDSPAAAASCGLAKMVAREPYPHTRRDGIEQRESSDRGALRQNLHSQTVGLEYKPPDSGPFEGM